MIADYYSDYDEFDDNCVAVISDRGSIREVERVIVHIRFGNTETKPLVDLGSVCSIFNRNLANAVVFNSQEIFWGTVSGKFFPKS